MLFISKDYLSVVPKVRLVANAGLADNRATHTGGWIYWGNKWSKAGSLNFPLINPQEIVCDKAADRLRERMDGAIFPRGLTWLGVRFHILRRLLSAIGRAAELFMPFLFKI